MNLDNLTEEQINDRLSSLYCANYDDRNLLTKEIHLMTQKEEKKIIDRILLRNQEMANLKALLENFKLKESSLDREIRLNPNFNQKEK
jgi:hypothetical protein